MQFSTLLQRKAGFQLIYLIETQACICFSAFLVSDSINFSSICKY